MRTLLVIGAVTYASATLAYLIELYRNAERPNDFARRLYVAASAYWLVAFPYGAVQYSLCVGLRPWLIVLAWALGAVFLWLERRYAIAALGSMVAALSTILCVHSIFLESSPDTLLSGPLADWVLWIHISLAFVGVIGFVFAAATSSLYLVVSGRLKNKKIPGAGLPSLDVLDGLALRSVIVGFPIYTVALLLGSAQAVRAGTGDIKLAYIFAALSWLIYGVVLQARLTAGWRGRNAAMLTIIGCISSLLVVGMYSTGTA
ncbi:MAG: cytochrome c biogenesis protein CcsA [Bradymonadia bacterium]